MSIIDVIILLIFAIFILGGIHRGFLNAIYGCFSTIGSFVLSLIFGPVLAGSFKGHSELYNTLLYYTEGAEYVSKTSVEYTRLPVSLLPADELKAIIDNADLPIPMGRCVMRNIATEAFSKQNVTTLGDYFNLTIVSVVLNIAGVLVLFIIFRLLFGIIIQGLDYGKNGYKSLAKYDSLIGAGVGFIEAILIVFAVFLIVPILITVLPKLYDFVHASFFGDFFYRANLILHLIPSV